MKQRTTIITLVLAVVVTALVTMSLPVGAQQMAVSHAQTVVATQPAAPNAVVPITDKPVARVNGTVLTDRDLQREVFALFPYAAQHNGQIPAELAPQIRQGALKMIVFEELVYQDALRRQVTVPAAKLQKAESDFRGQFPSASEYRQFLNAECKGSEKVLNEKIRRSLLIDAALKAEVDNKSTVSLADARAYYDKNPARFEYPESFAFQTISFLPPEKATAANLKELRKRAEDGLKQAKATNSYEQFGMLAEKISEDDYRVMMGDHKAVDRSKLAPEVVKALLAIKPGEITDILQLDTAYTIVRLNQHIPAGKRTFAEVKDSLQKELQKRKVEEVRASLDKRLRKSAKVEEL